MPTILVLAVIVGQIAGMVPARGQMIFYPTVHPGSRFQLSFDVSSSSVPPPYIQFSPLLKFAPQNQFGAGDGFTAQLFDSSGNAAGGSWIFLYHGADTPNLSFGLPLYEPFKSTSGYISFTNIVGSYGLNLDQWVIGYGRTSDTGYVEAQLQGVPLFPPVPEPATYGMFGAIGVLGLAIRRAWRQKNARGSKSPGARDQRVTI